MPKTVIDRRTLHKQRLNANGRCRQCGHRLKQSPSLSRCRPCLKRAREAAKVYRRARQVQAVKARKARRARVSA